MNSNNQLAVTQENLNRKDKQIDELNAICKKLKDNIVHLESQLRWVLVFVLNLQTHI